MNVRIKPVGDQAVLAVFEQKIAEDVHRKVMDLKKKAESLKNAGVREMIPAFASLLVCYDPLETDYLSIKEQLEALAQTKEDTQTASGKLVEIPVCYGGKYGEDLDFVARHAQLTAKEVIELHSGRDYLIYMLGFLPGFPYLGGMDERLFTPRLEAPRVRIPAGSVGIGGEQTGIYPLESPGGWQLIGRTPLTLFAPGKKERLPYETGDRIRFVPITETQFEQLSRRG